MDQDVGRAWWEWTKAHQPSEERLDGALGPSRLARMLGVTRQYVSAVRRGRTLITPEQADQMLVSLRAFGWPSARVVVERGTVRIEAV